MSNKICPQETYQVLWFTKIPKRFPCPTCKRKLKVYTEECQDEGCVHAYIPGGHKRKKWWKKTNE